MILPISGPKPIAYNRRWIFWMFFIFDQSKVTGFIYPDFHAEEKLLRLIHSDAEMSWGENAERFRNMLRMIDQSAFLIPVLQYKLH